MVSNYLQFNNFPLLVITQTAGNFCKDGVIMVAVYQNNMIQTVKHLMLFCNYVISLLINRRN